MDEIKHCSNIEIEIEIIGGEQKRLPVEEISNWLEPSADGTKINLQNHNERFLKINLNSTIQNDQEMFDNLKTVYFKTFVRIVLDEL